MYKLWAYTSIKLFKHKELWAVGAVMLFILSLPVLAFASVFNLTTVSNPGVTLYTGPGYAGDGYAFGNCTYWADMRRAQIGEPIPNNWGNAITWATNAALDGYVVDHTPSYGAIWQWPQAPGGLGHVAFVEQVNPDGSYVISEMNAAGFDEVDNRTYPASSDQDYNFIHTQAAL